MKKLLAIMNIAIAILIGGVFAFSPLVAAQSISSVDFNGSGTDLSGTGFGIDPSGRYLFYSTDNSGIVSGDTNGTNDVFRKDTKTGSVIRVSVQNDGSQSSGQAYYDGNAGNGRYVVFTSSATDLVDVSGISGYTTGIYLHDIKTGTNYLLKATSSSSTSYTYDDISSDGRYLFYSYSNSTSNGTRAGVYDRIANVDTEIGLKSDGTSSTQSGDTQNVKTDCAGRYVVFLSDRSDLVSDDTNGHFNIFLLDRMNNTLQNITINANDDSWSPQISCNGQFVLFDSGATNLTSSDSNGSNLDSYLYDVSNGTFERVSVDNSGNQYSSGENGGTLGVNGNGRYVTFTATDSSGVQQVFVRDRQNDTTTLLSANSSSQEADGSASSPIITSDGKEVYFISNATNLGVSNSGHANSYWYEVTGF